MAKSKRDKLSIGPEILEEIKKPPFVIWDAKIKDDFCHYSYEVTDGVDTGDIHNVVSTKIITDDLKHAFGLLKVHLAAVDDVFKHSDIEIENINKMHTHELTQMYHVTGIKIRGEEDNQTVVLVGSKHVSDVGGRIDISTPRIPLDESSSYEWAYQLKDLCYKIRSEVKLYKEGKYIKPVEDDDEKPNPKQKTISDAIKENEALNNAGSDSSTNDNNEFDNAKV